MSSISLGRNISSLVAQRNLDSSSARLAQNLERLSSGLRINHASDDAAGLAIASILRKDSRVYAQAIRNGNDALSALAVAEGSIESLSNVVLRMKELAQQSANGTFSRQQRLSMHIEGKALSDEFNRLTQSTVFNGLGITDGTLGQVGVQLGYGSNGQIGVNFGGALARSIGTGKFASSVAITVGIDTPTGTAIGDLNGDGNMDIIQGDLLSAVTIALGNGNGTFKAGPAGPAVFGNSVQTADFNGDGRLDIAATSGANIFIALGNGDGKFGSTTTITAVPMDAEMVVADLNGDGRADLVGRTTGSAVVTTLIAQANGSFTPGGTTTLGSTVADINVGDFDGDGKLDIVALEAGSAMNIIKGNGNGTFQAAAKTSLLGVPIALTVADFNYDGITDLALQSAAGPSVTTYLGNGNGTFAINANYVSAPTGFTLNSADMDGDGIVDLVVCGGVGVNTFKGNGDGTFQNMQSSTQAAGTNYLHLSDFNNDGVNDVLVGQGIQLILSSTQNSTSLQQVNLTTAATAREAMTTLDAALRRISSELGSIGSSQSRISSALQTLIAARENSESAAARITDADVAEESSHLLRNQIQQQASQAILAQANQSPKIALSLLQGI